MKGIIMAGGTGSRLFPTTNPTNKHFFPIAGKPMIYYSLSTLILSGAREILIITNRSSIDGFKAMLQHLNNLNLDIQFAIQDKPGGIPEGIILAEKFIEDDPFLLSLGDNIFYGPKLRDSFSQITNGSNGCEILCYSVNDPRAFGVAEIIAGKVINVEEKPTTPKSNYAITGLYKFDSSAVYKSKELVPSERGELEVTDLIKAYLKEDSVGATVIDRGFAWLDTGTYSDLRKADQFLALIEQNQGFVVACLEEMLLNLNVCSKQQIDDYVATFKKPNPYIQYLSERLNDTCC